MARLNLILLLVLTVGALGLVTSSHKARRLIATLEQERNRARQLDVEYGQLQIEQKTWANLGRIETIATERLKMQAPDQRRTRHVPFAEAAK